MAMSVLFSGCFLTSPKGAFALETKEYGQCRPLKRGERIAYKKRLVKFVCEDTQHVLFGNPYELKGDWYYKSGTYKGKKVSNISHAKVVKAFRNRCELPGVYGVGKMKVQMFYFDVSLKSCRPFEWSGDGGSAPFDSRDACEAYCYY